MSYRVFIDSFSGAASDLKGNNRTAENVFDVLHRDPCVSTWDMSQHPWLCGAIQQLKREGKIVELDEPYPWHRFKVIRQPQQTSEGGVSADSA